MLMKLKLDQVLITGLVFGLVACAAPADKPAWQAPGQRHKIAVKETSDRLNLVLGAGDAGLSVRHISTIRRFVKAWRDHGHGPLAISIPAGSNNAQVAVAAAAQTREVIYAEGVAFEQMAGGHYQARGEAAAPIILSFRRYTASAQGCSVASDNIATNFSNSISDDFGCFLAVNTAAMIADPYDLVSPRSLTSSEVDRRLSAYDKYIHGEGTAAERSSDEEGTISDVSE
ncbi:hypothetical protein MNBD_ALPHA06-1556 [hydrothermal vent metagenome]|uniref:Pilus assembly protein CpaD n=1 Tax=hydrothermal vent metagenome TaxID=652676 RepID=A0A3B0S0E4_9ZZZZ